MRCAIFLIVVLVIPSTSFSGTIIVPDDYPTIQQAIGAAGAGDTVLVRAGTYNELIDFSAKAITVTSEDGAANTTIDGDQLSGSVVTCASGEGADSVLNGFTITGGTGTGALYDKRGGGMYNSGSSPTVTNCTFDGNTADSGGGFFNKNSNPTVTECTFIGNSAIGSGGAMYSETASAPTITTCTFTENSSGGGGALADVMSIGSNFGSIVTHSEFSNNDAVLGGAIYSSRANTVVRHSIVTGNTAITSGGGMYTFKSTVEISHSSFIDNVATVENGGGLYLEQLPNGGPATTITDSLFKGNTAEYAGGGIGMGSGVEYTQGPYLTNCIISENQAAYGGGVSLAGGHNPEITNTMITNNTADVSGGGLLISGNQEQAVITNSTIVGNSAGSSAGGMFFVSGWGSPNDDLKTTNSIWWGNAAPHGSEMVVAYQGLPTILSISHSDVKGGQSSIHVDSGATLNWGAGMIDTDPLLVDPSSNDFHLTHCSPCRDWGDNNASSIPVTDFEGDPRIVNDSVDMGADEFNNYIYVPGTYPAIQDAIYAAPEGYGILVAPGTYLENIDFLGKAILIEGSPQNPDETVIDGFQSGSVATFQSAETEDSILEGFTLRNGAALEGGGVYCLNSSPTLDKNKIIGNVSTGLGGGGVYCFNGSPTIKNSFISQNVTTCSGGGVYCVDSSPVVVNTSIYQNSGSSGGGVFSDPVSSPVVTNSVVYDNSASSEGGGIHCGVGSPIITNSIVWQNTSPVGLQIQGTNPVITHCDVQGGWPGTGNIDADPMFLDPGSGNFHLFIESPCFNTGDNYASELPARDYDGDLRIMYFTVDMGVDEIHGGNIIHVPSDIPAIQGAIDAAVDGDIVLVDTGTYFENITFKGESIIVKSSSGAEFTTLDGNNMGNVVSFTHSEGQNSILQGFTITNGGDGYHQGGIICDGSSPIIQNNIIIKNSGTGVYCGNSSPIIRDNVIENNGYGIHCYYFSSPVIKNNVISRNTSGGMFNDVNSCPKVSNCTFTDNSGENGGGMHNDNQSNPMVINCTFTGNSAYVQHPTTTGQGGGMRNKYSSPTIINCTFTGNYAEYRGGGIYNEYCSPTITNCTFSVNESDQCGGLYNFGSSPIVTNCIFWNDIAGEIYNASAGSAIVTYSCIQGGYPGTGNIDADPFFLDPLNDDYHLSYASHCIDAGDNYAPSLPATDFEGDPRIFPGNGKGVYLVGSLPQPAIVDMGADEFCLMKKLEYVIK